MGLTGDVTTAVAINNAGSVLVSDFHPSTLLTTYLIYYADGTTQTLPGGLYTAMNNQGQAVNSLRQSRSWQSILERDLNTADRPHPPEQPVILDFLESAGDQ